MFILNRISEVRVSVALYVIESFAAIGVDDVFTIFASTEPWLGESSLTSARQQNSHEALQLIPNVMQAYLECDVSLSLL